MDNSKSNSEEIAAATSSDSSQQHNLFLSSLLAIWSLPNEIWFDIFAFVKLYESPNIFLVNSYLLPICQEFFHSGNIEKRRRNIHKLKMRLSAEGELTIFVKKRNGTYESVSIPEVDPPKIFKSFGEIQVRKCCWLQGMQFLNKFQSLLSNGNFSISCHREFLLSNVGSQYFENFGRFPRWKKQEKNYKIFQEKKSFLEILEKKKCGLQLKRSKSCKEFTRFLSFPLVAKYNGQFSISFKSERNLSKDDAKLIYAWISSTKKKGVRLLQINHFNGKKALELAQQIANLFKKDHFDKTKAEKMELTILLPSDSMPLPMEKQKICNAQGDHLATLRTFTVNFEGLDIKTSAYVFYTNPTEYYNDKKKEIELFCPNILHFY